MLTVVELRVDICFMQYMYIILFIVEFYILQHAFIYFMPLFLRVLK